MLRRCLFLLSNHALFSGSHVVSARFKGPHNGFIVNCASSGDITSADETPIELKYPAFPKVMDINQIQEILPHRFPFVLVDRVIEYTPGVSAVAIKNDTINDNFFPGYFPKRPIMPGVLMVEFLSGGQSEVQVTLNLNGMNQSPNPWHVSFSYARALQNSVLKTWQEHPENTEAAQKSLLVRAKANSLAQLGKYSAEGESEEAKKEMFVKGYTY